MRWEALDHLVEPRGRWIIVGDVRSLVIGIWPDGRRAAPSVGATDDTLRLSYGEVEGRALAEQLQQVGASTPNSRC